MKYGLKEDKIQGILFDISYLWEEYLATILTRHGFIHPNNRKYIGRIYLAKRNMFPRYPDFYRKSDDTIIDAKYKTGTENREDVHQMITYLYRLKGKYGIFIHPTIQEHERKTYFLQGYGESNDTELQTYLFHIPQETDNYRKFITQIIESEKLLSIHMSMLD